MTMREFVIRTVGSDFDDGPVAVAIELLSGRRLDGQATALDGDWLILADGIAVHVDAVATIRRTGDEEELRVWLGANPPTEAKDGSPVRFVEHLWEESIEVTISQWKKGRVTRPENNGIWRYCRGVYLRKLEVWAEKQEMWERIAELLEREGPLTLSQIAEAVWLPVPVVRRILDLGDGSWWVRAGRSSSGRGRPILWAAS